MSITRKIVKPSIVQQRIEAQNANNVWNYVTVINSKLETNPIQVDLAIIISFKWDIDQSMVDQITEIYTAEGWTVDSGVAGEQVQAYPGETIFEFRPPVSAEQ